MTAPIPFLDRLGTQLDEAPAPKPAVATRVVVAVVILGLVGFLTATALRPAPSPSLVSVTDLGGRLQFRLHAGVTADAIEMTAAQRGLDVEVDELATGPSQVGWLFVAELPGVQFVDQVSNLARAFTVTPDAPGPIELTLGRAAADGEAYLQLTDAFAVGEPLACLDLLGRGPADVQARLADRDDLRVRWAFAEPDGRPVEVDAAGALDAEWAGHRLASATTFDATRVRLWFTRPGQDLLTTYEGRRATC